MTRGSFREEVVFRGLNLKFGLSAGILGRGNGSTQGTEVGKYKTCSEWKQLGSFKHGL